MKTKKRRKKIKKLLSGRNTSEVQEGIDWNFCQWCIWVARQLKWSPHVQLKTSRLLGVIHGRICCWSGSFILWDEKTLIRVDIYLWLFLSFSLFWKIQRVFVNNNYRITCTQTLYILTFSRRAPHTGSVVCVDPNVNVWRVLDGCVCIYKSVCIY